MAYPATQSAWRMIPKNLPKITKRQVPVRDPNDDEAVIKVLAVGLCHSDIGLLDPILSKDHPAEGWTLGHEICGTIVAFGKNARSMHPHLELGSRVAVYQVNACQLPTCPECGLGYENLCEAALGSGLGIGTDGGFADYVTLPARSLYLVPEGMDSSIAAVATDACTTGYHGAALASITPEDIVLVLGVGGVGASALQTAKGVFKAGTVLAVDLHPQKRELAKTLGADYVGTESEIRALVAEKKLRPTVVLDCVGLEVTIKCAIDLLRARGRLVMIGVGNYTYKMEAVTMDMKGITLFASFAATLKEHREVLHAIQDGVLTPKVEIRPLDEIEQAIEDLEEGKVLSRFVLIP